VRRGVRGSHPRYKSRFRLEQGFYPRYDPRMACARNVEITYQCMENHKGNELVYVAPTPGISHVSASNKGSTPGMTPVWHVYRMVWERGYV
jgi:hypothetical protein